MIRSRTRGGCACPALALSLVAALVGGCGLRALRQEERAHRSLATLGGTVRTAHASSHPLVVILARLGEQGALEIAGSYAVFGPGSWVFRVRPGRYALGAFEDVSEDLVFRNEPAILPAEGLAYQLDPGDVVSDVELIIPPEPPVSGRDPFDVLAALEAVRARPPDEQVAVTLDLISAIGEVAGLADQRFDRRYAVLGVTQPNEFVNRVRPGIYLLEPYDPDRTPVLFVHGMRGSPRDFEALVAGLDRERFQPWVLYYPSGARLTRISQWAAAKLLKLQLRLRFERLCVVAHSMGGLIARALILDYNERTRDGDVALFVSISTPWGGDRTAGLGVRLTPESRATWAAWRDLAPNSEFLRGLFLTTSSGQEAPRRLPPGVAYHLVFGHPDAVVPPESALWLVQHEEAPVRRFPAGHVEILESPETIAWVNQLLAGGGE